ncbi:MAG: dihydrolipoamide acetyltransferase family protein [Anaerohalosphaeraceae bacterium]|jgi:pyruvate dehydrogenase E2 component (dihydrolipoamide acetyltransferase)
MATEIVLPQLGKTMKEGTLVNIRFSPGDRVAVGDILFDIETDKATLEMESEAEGVVKAVLVEAGQTVPVHTPLLILGEKDESLDSTYLAQIASHVRAAVLVDPSARPVSDAASGSSGVSIAQTLRDTEAQVRCIPARPGKPQLGSTVPLSRTQRIIAEKMVWSKQNIPCFYLNIRVDVTKLTELRSDMNADSDTQFSVNDFIIRALALGIEHYPIMTGQLAAEHIQLSGSIDIGLAISTEEGVVAPIVKDCGRKTLLQISEQTATLVERTRDGKLQLEDLSGGCTSVSNLGAFGVDSFIPIVIPGQSSIVGVGTIQDVVLPVDKEPAVRKIMNLTLSVDHKVINGAEAAQFLDFVKKLLEHPDELA